MNTKNQVKRITLLILGNNMGTWVKDCTLVMIYPAGSELTEEEVEDYVGDWNTLREKYYEEFVAIGYSDFRCGKLASRSATSKISNAKSPLIKDKYLFKCRENYYLLSENEFETEQNIDEHEAY